MAKPEVMDRPVVTNNTTNQKRELIDATNLKPRVFADTYGVKNIHLIENNGRLFYSVPKAENPDCMLPDEMRNPNRLSNWILNISSQYNRISAEEFIEFRDENIENMVITVGTSQEGETVCVLTFQFGGSNAPAEVFTF